MRSGLSLSLKSLCLPFSSGATANRGMEHRRRGHGPDQWNPAHPGAQVERGSTASTYAPPNPHGAYRQTPRMTTHNQLASSFSLFHPAPTAADINSVPLSPPNVRPDPRSSEATIAAGNGRQPAMSYHFEHCFRGRDDWAKPNAPSTRMLPMAQRECIGYR